MSRSKLRSRSRRVGSRRRGTFETLEARLALAADLGFAGAFQILGGPATDIYSSSGHNDNRGGGMVTDGAGNRYVTVNGAFDHIVDLDPGPAVQAATIDAAMVKLDPSGGVVWSAAFNATGPATAPVVRVLHAVDAEQNVYLVGDFRGTVDFDPGPGVTSLASTSGGTDYGFYMAKLSSAGQLLWVRTLAAPELTPTGVEVDGAGNLVIVSNFTAVTSDPPMDVDAGPGTVLVQEKGVDYDLVVLKYSTDGDFVWVRQIGNASASMYGANPGLGVNDQGDVFVSSRFTGSLDLDPGAGVHTVTSNETTSRGFLVRLDPVGNMVWTYTSEGTGSAHFREIELANDGSIVLGGYFGGVTDFQPGSGSLTLTSVGASANGLVVKLNGDSSVAWARGFGGLGSTLVTDIDIDQQGAIFLGGSFGSSGVTGQTADFDPGPGVYDLLRPSTYETAFVLSLTDEGDFRWAVPLGGNTGRAQVQGISVSSNGDVQISGAFRKAGDFDPNPGAETWLTSSGNSQTVFTATLAQSGPIPGAPVVEAGLSQTILVTGSATLDGTATDDGLPNPLTTSWSLQSGPGTVTFGDASALHTTVAFSAIGTYLLKLEATDGEFTTADYVHIIVNPLTAMLTATADAYIDNGKATTNFGASTNLIVDGKSDDGALLKWNLSSIPTGSTLQSATLSINVTGTSTDTYEIYELKRSWSEPQATWKKATSAINWQSAGAQGSLDRGSTVLGTVTAPATGVRNIVLNAAGLAVVQGWVNAPATSFGFILQDYANAADDDLVFSSREATVAANRPQLQVVYSPPSVAPQSVSRAAASASLAAAADVFAAPVIAAKRQSAPGKSSQAISANASVAQRPSNLTSVPTETSVKQPATAAAVGKHDRRRDDSHADATDDALDALDFQCFGLVDFLN